MKRTLKTIALVLMIMFLVGSGTGTGLSKELIEKEIIQAQNARDYKRSAQCRDKCHEQRDRCMKNCRSSDSKHECQMDCAREIMKCVEACRGW